MNKKNNQLYHNTEIKLKAAMLDLMKNTSPEKITVKKICEKANVNRSTFYAHFIDIYDLMDKMELKLHQELLQSYEDLDPGFKTIFSYQSFIPFFTHIKKHQYFYKINLQTRKNFPLKQGYERLWHEIFKPYCLHAGISSENEMMYYFVFFQSGFTMILKRWVDTGCVETEKEMAQLAVKCIPKLY